MVIDSGEVVLRTVPTLHISGLFFSTFFGGDSPDYATPSDQYAYFKNFRIYRYLY